MQCNARLGQRHTGLDLGQRLGGLQVDLQNVLCTPPQYGQSAMRWHTPYLLTVVKVIAKLGHLRLVLVLARDQAGAKQTLRP